MLCARGLRWPELQAGRPRHALHAPPSAEPQNPLPTLQARRLRPRDVFFIDVGANVGVYTLFVAAYGFNVIAVGGWVGRVGVCGGGAEGRRVC